MSQTTVSIRMDENLKKQLEYLCSELGMNITTAMTIFAKTVVRERRIPFEIALDLPTQQKTLEDMTKKEIDAKIQAGLDAIASGNVRSAKDAFHDIQRKYKK